MKVFCLGGAGRICREAIHDLVQFSDFEQITVADLTGVAVQDIQISTAVYRALEA